MRVPEAQTHGNCDLCGKRLPRNKDGSVPKNRRWCSTACSHKVTRNHLWSWARKEALKRDNYTCVKCGSSWSKLEVNHIVPLVGRGYHAGCVHHLENLETTCKSCHVTITKSQREERKNAKP
jgi:5-methylcytosine-specific restriction endonuclease McrA